MPWAAKRKPGCEQTHLCPGRAAQDPPKGCPPPTGQLARWRAGTAAAIVVGGCNKQQGSTHMYDARQFTMAEIAQSCGVTPNDHLPQHRHRR